MEVPFKHIFPRQRRHAVFFDGSQLNEDSLFESVSHLTEKYRKRTHDVRLGNHLGLTVSKLLTKLD